MLERIQRESGVPELIDLLVERLAPTDLQSLLLQVYRRRLVGVKPNQLLRMCRALRQLSPCRSAEPRTDTTLYVTSCCARAGIQCPRRDPSLSSPWTVRRRA